MTGVLVKRTNLKTGSRGRRLSAGQGEQPQKEPTLPAPCSGRSSFQSLRGPISVVSATPGTAQSESQRVQCPQGRPELDTQPRSPPASASSPHPPPPLAPDRSPRLLWMGGNLGGTMAIGSHTGQARPPSSLVPPSRGPLSCRHCWPGLPCPHRDPTTPSGWAAAGPCPPPASPGHPGSGAPSGPARLQAHATLPSSLPASRRSRQPSPASLSPLQTPSFLTKHPPSSFHRVLPLKSAPANGNYMPNTYVILNFLVATLLKSKESEVKLYNYVL